MSSLELEKKRPTKKRGGTKKFRMADFQQDKKPSKSSSSVTYFFALLIIAAVSYVYVLPKIGL